MTEHQPDHYTQVSSHLQSAGGEVTQLLDLLTEGLALDAQVQRDAGHRARTPDRTADRPPDNASGNGTRRGRGPGAGGPR